MDSTLEQAMLQGLTEQEARERLATDGYNELPSAKKRTFFHILLEVLREPMFLMLIACGVLYLFLGDQEEAIMLMGFVFVVIGNLGFDLRQPFTDIIDYSVAADSKQGSLVGEWWGIVLPDPCAHHSCAARGIPVCPCTSLGDGAFVRQWIGQHSFCREHQAESAAESYLRRWSSVRRS